MTPARPEALQVALRVIEVSERLGVEYHLGGSYARSIHGVPRQTQDVDLVADLTPQQVEPLAAAPGSDFYADSEPARRAVEQRSSFNLLHLPSGVKVDVSVSATRRSTAPSSSGRSRRDCTETIR